jgi:predicted DNA-binding protein (MmcQ/YjbR family)
VTGAAPASAQAPRRARHPDAGFERQRALTAGLPGATEDVKWGADLVHSVGSKMFAIYLLDAHGKARSCSFKVDDDRFLELTAVPGVTPAPYLARVRWVQVREPHALAAADLDALMHRSHALVASRLPKKTRLALGLGA